RLAYCCGAEAPFRLEDAWDSGALRAVPRYFYVQEIDARALQLAERFDVTLGFHPHAFTRFDQIEVSRPHFPEGNPHAAWPTDPTAEDPEPWKLSAAMLRPSNEPLERCYRSIATAVREYFHALHASLWSGSEARDDLSLLATSPSDPACRVPMVLSRRDSVL